MQIESAETDPSASVGDCYYMAAGYIGNIEPKVQKRDNEISKPTWNHDINVLPHQKFEFLKFIFWRELHLCQDFMLVLKLYCLYL